MSLLKGPGVQDLPMAMGDICDHAVTLKFGASIYLDVNDYIHSLEQSNARPSSSLLVLPLLCYAPGLRFRPPCLQIALKLGFLYFLRLFKIF